MLAMANLLFRNLLATAPAILAYTVLAPLGALWLERLWGLNWPIPAWLSFAGIPLILLGAAIAFWSVWTLAHIGRGTPNPLLPPTRFVAVGPYRFSRNPMMLGGWVAGLGLAFVLRSPSLLVLYGFIVLAGMLYVCRQEEPKLVERFGEAYRAYTRSVPRWLKLCPGIGR